MKKITAIILALGLCLSLCGCAEKLKSVEIPPMPTKSPAPVSTPEPVEEPEEEIEAAGLTKRIIFTVNQISFADPDPLNGFETILHFSCQMPTIFIEGNDSATALINERLGELCGNLYSEEEVPLEMDEHNSLLSLAESNYSEDNNPDFYFSHKISMIRADDNIIAIKINTEKTTFDKEKPERSEEVHYFDTSSGTELSEDLALSDAYPEAEKTGNGSLEVIALGEGDASSDIIDLYVADEEGKDFLLVSTGLNNDVNIADLWYCNYMLDCSVQLRAELPEGVPVLMISYTSQGLEHHMLFSVNAETGAPELTDFSTIAVVG